MNGGLFDNLVGHYQNGIPVDAVPPKLRDILSIADHLTFMFNSRIGTCANRKYGLPSDLPDTLSEIPENIKTISDAIINTILVGEPRLCKPMIVKWLIYKEECRLQGILTGLFKGERVKMRVVLKGMGRHRVELFEGE